jgi:hypothetical protein
MSKNQITFYDSHKPALQDGDYEVTVKQNLLLKNAKIHEGLKKQTLNFTVTGPKFDLDPSLIDSVYPPVGGKGDYMAALPSLVLNRSTLPWERKPKKSMTKDESASWLFLLLVDETEMHMGIEKNSIDIHDQFPISIEKKERERLPSKANYLELDESLLHLFPLLEELNYLSYVRIKKGGEEKAVLLCNRLPQKGKNSTVYLVSLENSYTGSNFTGNNIPNKKDETKKYIPYLYKWQFHTFDDELFSVTEAVSKRIAATLPDFNISVLSSINDTVYTSKENFVEALNTLKIQDPKKKIIPVIQTLAKLPGSTFHELLHHLPGGFKPLNLDKPVEDMSTDNTAKDQLIEDISTKDQSSKDILAKAIKATGTVELPFNKIEKKEKGDLPFYTSAYYRGPFAASVINRINSHFPLITEAPTNTDNPARTSIPVHASQLILKGNSGEEDTSYAAAYELGRLMAINDVDFSTEFYKWKDETAKAKRIEYLKSIGGYKNILHLPLTDTPQANDIPKHVKDKFDSWKQLKGIPFRYLIPDPELLPNESIRFFQVDHNWVNAFVCGAFSIGHTVETDLTEELTDLFQNTLITGFLVNSLVVKAWPDFEVDAYDHVTHGENLETTLKLIRKDNLDASIQLRLHEGVTQQLNFHLHPGKMHSGFLFEEGKFLKAKKDTNIEGLPKGHILAVVNKDNLVVKINDLKTNLGATSISDFAAKMIEGTPTVVFRIR